MNTRRKGFSLPFWPARAGKESAVEGLARGKSKLEPHPDFAYSVFDRLGVWISGHADVLDAQDSSHRLAPGCCVVSRNGVVLSIGVACQGVQGDLGGGRPLGDGVLGT